MGHAFEETGRNGSSRMFRSFETPTGADWHFIDDAEHSPVIRISTPAFAFAAGAIAGAFAATAIIRFVLR